MTRLSAHRPAHPPAGLSPLSRRVAVVLLAALLLAGCGTARPDPPARLVEVPVPVEVRVPVPVRPVPPPELLAALVRPQPPPFVPPPAAPPAGPPELVACLTPAGAETLAGYVDLLERRVAAWRAWSTSTPAAPAAETTGGD